MLCTIILNKDAQLKKFIYYVSYVICPYFLRIHGEKKTLSEAIFSGERETVHDKVEVGGFFEREKNNNRGVLSITPRAIIDSTTRTHGINEHCKM